ncbi:MMPL family protein [Aquisphaera giovannonii]|uniref:MMPL family protein n=1 Tax=Aquisphaera giovannonii TaxID=406548 RepID=A0A5B9W3D2_9BACT|nr:MMPL family transporter [Aquisphaera giovannonii]QEH34450.1 MMPL family protein [Aquisphaera giovannonii]
MIGFLLRVRYLAAAATAVLLVLLVLFGKKVSYEQSIGSFFAEDDPYMSVYQEAAGVFGDDNFVFLVYDDPDLVTPAGLDRVAELAAAVSPGKVPGVSRVESLDAMPLVWAIDDALLALEKLPAFARNAAMNAARRTVKNVDLKTNAMAVAGAVRSADAAGLAALKERLRHHPMFRGTLISEDGNSTAVVARLRKTHEHNVIQTVAALRAEADAFAARHGLGRPAVVGPPVLLADGFAAIEVDGRRLAAVGMVLIALVTLVAVHSVWWAIVPMAAGWTIWLATETLLNLFHIRLSLSGGPLVAQIIVLTMPAASHLAIHFRENLRQRNDPAAAGRATLRAVAVPILWTAITGAIGYGALVTSDVMPIQQFGAILGACTLCSAILVMALSPIAMLPPFPLEVPVREGSRSSVAGGMNRLSFWVSRHPMAVVATVAAVVVPLSLGMFNLRYETNYINLFRRDTRVVNDYRVVESKLGGIGLVEVVVPLESPVTPAALGRLTELDRKIAATPVADPRAIAQVLSLATVLDPDGRLKALPEEAEARVLASKLELIGLSPQAGLLRSFWNAEAGRARVLVRLLEQQPAPTKARIFREAVAAAREAFGPSSYLTGLSYLMTRTTEGVISTQWTTFFWSALGILLMLTLAFRSPALAVLAILPTLLSVALVLGLMGWLSIKLDMATALVASVALGLSVDDTFHCLIQFHRERKTRGFRKSLFDSYRVSGPGVLLSSLAVAVGFTALRTSEFAPFVNFGTMVAVATAGSTLGNLVLLPACLTLGERWSKSRVRPVPATAGNATGVTLHERDAREA